MPQTRSRKWRLAQSLEIKWWERYLGKKDVESYLEWKRQYWVDFLARLDGVINLPAGSRVLDAGCGPAGIFIALKGMQVDALDPLLSEYESKLAHFSKARYPGINFLEGSIEELSAENKYDVIFCLNAINHVSGIRLSLGNLIKAVKPDGTIVISADAHNYLLLRNLFRMIPGDVLHPHQYSLKGYSMLIEAAGAEITGVIRLKSSVLFSYYVIIARKI